MTEQGEPVVVVPNDELPRNYLHYLLQNNIAVGGILVIKFEQSDGSTNSGVRLRYNGNESYNIQNLNGQKLF